MFWVTDMAGCVIPLGMYGALTTVKEVLTPLEIENRLRGFAAQMKGND
jgi:hypothetical protein